MTREQFIKNMSELRWVYLRNVLVSLLLAGASGLIFIWLKSDWIDSQPSRQRVFVAFMIPALLIGALIVASLMNAQATDRLGLNCPRCDQELSRLNARIAIATGNCGSCGSPVFSAHDEITGIPVDGLASQR